ncbi:MAG: hypothetical protein IJW99_01395 [Clostridia bacterium]|nr:hypothetical protein [Clostridia bacterium]
MKNKLRYLLLILAACLLLTGCGKGGKLPGTETSGNGDGTDPSPELLEFNYGRLVINNRFVTVSDENVNFTLNFEKKMFTPRDDIVLTVYVTNYTGDELIFDLPEPIISRQQLVHASLTYGNGQYEVPVTVAYEPDRELGGGVETVSVRDRKLIATTVTFHTSAYENIEESIFSDQYADTYEMNLWFGAGENTYRAATDVNYLPLSWNSAEEIQSLVLPESYVRLVGDVRFTVNFPEVHCGTDDDIRMHVKVENVGIEPIKLHSTFDVSQPSYYVRAEMTYGNLVPVRDNVASPSEIAGIDSTYQLKRDEALERDITFYTSEFQAIKRSVFFHHNREYCVLKVWLMVEGEISEIQIPIEYDKYLPYSYHDREVPPIVEPEYPVTEPIETTGDLSETTDEPSETTEEPSETTGEPSETTEEPSETTEEPSETTEEPAETTEEPAETTGEPAETTGEPVETTEEPAETTGEPSETTGEPAETTGEPVETTEEPAETTGEPAETTGEPAETTGEPAETTGEPAETTEEPAENMAEEPTDTTGEPGETELVSPS